jgi:hypothetical protein
MRKVAYFFSKKFGVEKITCIFATLLKNHGAFNGFIFEKQ